MTNDTHNAATAREALRDLRTFGRARARIARAVAIAESEGRTAWARLARASLDSIGLGAEAASHAVARMAVAGVDVHRLSVEVSAERSRA